MRVLAVDPGPHVGLALYTCADDDPLGMEEEFTSWEGEPYPALDECRQLILGGIDAVVCEGFRIGGSRAKEANVTIEMIGVLRWICFKRGVLFVEQTPGLGKRWSGARWEKLKRLGWYAPGPDHRNSAAGHLIHYLAETAPGFASRLLP